MLAFAGCCFGRRHAVDAITYEGEVVERTAAPFKKKRKEKKQNSSLTPMNVETQTSKVPEDSSRLKEI